LNRRQRFDKKNRQYGVAIMFSEITAGIAFRQSSSTKAATSDETLIDLIAKGDKDAMRVLFARHSTRVFRFLVRIVADQAAAEDLLNEVFLEIWRQAGQFEGRSRASTWMLAIARYKALSSLRRHSFEGLDEDVAETLEDPADGPEIVMQKTDRSEILQDCLKHLSAAQREVIDLVYYHERSIDEAAEITGLPQNTVKTRVFYARRRLAQLVAQRGLESTCI
jgi:RNA polymerase sigma-70 factor, ECF subfamily